MPKIVNPSVIARKHWKNDEIVVLISCVKSMAGTPPPQITTVIAQRLNRSVFSVNGQIARILYSKTTPDDVRSLLTTHVRRSRKRKTSHVDTYSPAAAPQPSLPRIEVSPIHSFAACQFLSGDPRKRNFCAKPVSGKNKPYCDKHMKACYC